MPDSLSCHLVNLGYYSNNDYGHTFVECITAMMCGTPDCLFVVICLSNDSFVGQTAHLIHYA